MRARRRGADTRLRTSAGRTTSDQGGARNRRARDGAPHPTRSPTRLHWQKPSRTDASFALLPHLPACKRRDRARRGGTGSVWNGHSALTAAIVALLGAPAGWLSWRIVRGYAPQSGKPAALTLIAATIAVFVWAALVVPTSWVLPASLLLGWALVMLAAIDFAVFRLPDRLTLPLLAAGLAISYAPPGSPGLDHLLGAAAGYGSLAALAFAWRRWRGVEGVGLGDAKLLGVAGAWLGWRPLPAVVLVACAAAFALVAVRAVTRGRSSLGERVAFGAPLSLAIWTVWLYGPSDYST